MIIHDCTYFKISHITDIFETFNSQKQENILKKMEQDLILEPAKKRDHSKREDELPQTNTNLLQGIHKRSAIASRSNSPLAEKHSKNPTLTNQENQNKPKFRSNLKVIKQIHTERRKSTKPKHPKFYKNYSKIRGTGVDPQLFEVSKMSYKNWQKSKHFVLENFQNMSFYKRKF